MPRRSGERGLKGSPLDPDEPNGVQVPTDDLLMRSYAEMVGPLGETLSDAYEVVLHDLRLLPNSIVAVHGDVTGRRVGDPATDLLLERAVVGELDHMVGYRTRLPDGRSMRSSTMIIRNLQGEALGALCINADISMWESLERTVAMMTGRSVLEPQTSQSPAPEVEGLSDQHEVFARDLDELASNILHQSIREQGVPVELMRKEHKIEVVRALKSRGIFMLRDAVETVASSLGVTRFTIYNYLNQINEEDAPASHLDALPSTNPEGHLT